jgi:hypothetical protein
MPETSALIVVRVPSRSGLRVACMPFLSHCGAAWITRLLRRLRPMGRRSRKRAKRVDRAPGSTDYADAEGNVLTLRDELSAGTLRKISELDARPSASAEDRWQRRVEFLFERLAVRWEIAGLPLEGQKELLGRYRLASSAERRHVREALAEHLARRHPEIEL